MTPEERQLERQAKKERLDRLYRSLSAISEAIPVAKGHIRAYRGEASGVDYSSGKGAAGLAERGRFWTKSLEEAIDYAGEGGNVLYQDIHKNVEFEARSAAVDKGTPGLILPTEYIGKGLSLTDQIQEDDSAAKPTSGNLRENDLGLQQMLEQPPPLEPEAAPEPQPGAREPDPVELTEQPEMEEDQTVAHLGEAIKDTPLPAALAGEAEPAKKKRPAKQPNWGKFLGTLGGQVHQFGGAIGSKHVQKMGGMIQGAGHILKMIDLLGGQSRGGEEAGDARASPSTGTDDAPAPADLLQTTGGGDEPAATGDAAQLMEHLAAGSTAGPAGSEQVQPQNSDLQTALRDLIEAVHKLTEEMQKQHGKSGDKDGDMMPLGGSFGGSGDGSTGGNLKELIDIIQLISTMSRMLALAA